MAKQWRPNWSMPVGSRDRWTQDYERGRPGWPSGVVEFVDPSTTRTVLDLGAGTGKLTSILASAFVGVVAVEPADAMRRILVKRFPGVRALSGSAEAIPLPDDSVDAVFVGQAFHTFDGPRALSEIARVLRPRGVVVLLWNLPAGPWQPPTAEAEAILAERMPDVDYIPLDLGGPAASSGWQPKDSAALFERFQATVLPNPLALDRDGLVAFYATMGWLADLADDERLPLLAKVRSRLAAETYQRPWETHAHWSQLREC